MKHYIRQKTDNSIQYTRHLIHKPRSIVLSKGHLTRNTFKSNIFMLINKLIVKFYVHGSLGVLQSWYLAYWWVSNCFFHELSYVKSLDFGPTFFVVIFNVICLTINNLSGILDTTDTSFVHPWWPSGLRCWFKAPVSSGAWVRIPLLPGILYCVQKYVINYFFLFSL